MVDDHAAVKRARVRAVQHYVLNPPVKLAVWTGLIPGYVLVETTGRRSGKRRRNVVGMKVDGNVGWVVAEQGRHAGYASNLSADPRVRIRLRGQWRPARAEILDDDDPQARLDTFGRPTHAATIRTFGTDLTTIRFDLDPSD